MNILVINGPNLNMLGVRESQIYGVGTLSELERIISAHLSARGCGVEFFQSNHEGAIVDAIQSAYQRLDGIIINPAAYTHTSVAIPDAIRAVGLPAVEVHLSDIYAREPYRAISYTSSACVSQVYGKGFDGYIEAADILISAINAARS